LVMVVNDHPFSIHTLTVQLGGCSWWGDVPIYTWSIVGRASSRDDSLDSN
jgi:hypothetical protein